MASADVATDPPVAAVVAGAADERPKRGKTAKEPKAKKPAAPRKARSSSSHPPFAVMITEAIVALKERTGSSQHAITKFIEEKHKQLPGNFRKLLLVQLKRLVASGKLVKVKHSFKLSPTGSSSSPAPTGNTVAAKKRAEKSAATVKRKPKTEAVTGVKRKAKSAKTETKASPVKKAKKSATVGRPSKAVTAAVTKKKSATPVKGVRKPKSVKSPVKGVRKPKSVKSPVKRPAAAAGKRGKK